jgi:hypothetical protein
MEKRKRVPVFIPSWTTTYPWLQNGISGMTCTVCTKFDKTGTFITGCKNYKREDEIRRYSRAMNQRNGIQRFLQNNVIGCYTYQQGLY